MVRVRIRVSVRVGVRVRVNAKEETCKAKKTQNGTICVMVQGWWCKTKPGPYKARQDGRRLGLESWVWDWG